MILGHDPYIFRSALPREILLVVQLSRRAATRMISINSPSSRIQRPRSICPAHHIGRLGPTPELVRNFPGQAGRDYYLSHVSVY